RLQVPMKDEGAIRTAQQLARQRNRAREAIVKRGHGSAKVQRDDGGAARRAGMVPWIRKAGGSFEQHLELEQGFLAALQGERGEPRFALGALFPLQRARLA